jgi:hypothetical protein
MTAEPCRVSRRRPGWPGAGFRALGRSRRWSVSVRWLCTPRSSGLAATCCAGTRRTWPRYAEVFARLTAELADVTVAPPLPNPPWVRWDHADSGVWPAIDFLDNRDQSVVPAFVVEAAERTRQRILAAGLPCVLGHADFEAQNLRWHGREVWAVHDWDSLAWQPEAALAGAASGAFASAGPPTLAPVESSEAFLVAYQDIRGRRFTAVEREIAWAASLWMAAYNAREEALHGETSLCRDALRAQAAERLRRANAGSGGVSG